MIKMVKRLKKTGLSVLEYALLSALNAGSGGKAAIIGANSAAVALAVCK